jgi:hypothetical protein
LFFECPVWSPFKESIGAFFDVSKGPPVKPATLKVVTNAISISELKKTYGSNWISLRRCHGSMASPTAWRVDVFRTRKEDKQFR